MADAIGIVLRIDAADSDEAEVAVLSRNLRAELLALDVDDVAPVESGAIPPGAKSGQALAFGTLLVTAAPMLIDGVVDVVVSWLRRQPIEIEIEIGGERLKGTVTARQRDALVQALIKRLDQVGPAESSPTDN